MRLKKMVTLDSKQWQTITPGIVCDAMEQIVVNETDEIIHCVVSPKKNAEITVYFQFPEHVQSKSYVIQVDFYHEHAQVNVMGLYQLRDKQKATVKTLMNHFVPHCVSKQIWRGVLRDESHAVFEGNIIVHEQAQKTNAQLSNKNLLLSKQAQVNTKPQLEIYADDVKCSHGATVGCLDDNALFYLRSRGVAEVQARDMLVNAFIDEVKNSEAHAVA
jgi:Fe-S cluster assembly scaffold protein SufB